VHKYVHSYIHTYTHTHTYTSTHKHIYKHWIHTYQQRQCTDTTESYILLQCTHAHSLSHTHIGSWLSLDPRTTNIHVHTHTYTYTYTRWIHQYQRREYSYTHTRTLSHTHRVRTRTWRKVTPEDAANLWHTHTKYISCVLLKYTNALSLSHVHRDRTRVWSKWHLRTQPSWLSKICTRRWM